MSRFEVLHDRLEVEFHPTHYEKVQGEHGTGFKTVSDPAELITVQVLIDTERLKDLARKAAFNRQGKSRAGALQVKVIGRKALL